METNIERIREKLIQKEMAEVLRKVQDGEFTKEAEALAAQARRRERKRQLWRESPLEYIAYTAVKAAGSFFYLFVKFPELVIALGVLLITAAGIYIISSIPCIS